MRLLFRASALGPLVISAACFSYVPTEPQSLAPGENVRVYLTRQGMLDLGQFSGESAPYVRGTLLRAESDQLFVRIPTARRQVGFFQEQVGQEIAIRRGEIVQLERRKLDRTGTALLVAGTAAAATGVILLIVDAWGSENVVEPPPDELRVPIFSIRLGR
jgi:hypothetical protein